MNDLGQLLVITKCQQNNLVTFMKIKPEMKIDIEKKGKRGSEGSKTLRHIHSLRQRGRQKGPAYVLSIYRKKKKPEHQPKSKKAPTHNAFTVQGWLLLLPFLSISLGLFIHQTTHSTPFLSFPVAHQGPALSSVPLFHERPSFYPKYIPLLDIVINQRDISRDAVIRCVSPNCPLKVNLNCDIDTFCEDTTSYLHK